MEKIIHMEIIGTSGDLMRATIKNGDATYDSYMNKERLDYKLWVQAMIEIGRLSESDAATLDKLVDDLISVEILDNK